MNKNIYVDLADKLDSIGLYQESDEITKIFSSTNSFIKTAQSSELDAILGDSEKLTGWSSMILKTLGVSGIAGLTPFLVSAIGRQKELRDAYFQNVEVEAEPDIYNAKTVDQAKINKLKQEHQAALKSNKPKTEIEIQLPNNKKPYNPGDPETYTVQKYKVLDKKEITSKDKSGNPITKEIKNSIINEFSNPEKYIQDLVIDGMQETIPVKKTTTKKIVPKEQMDKYYNQQAANNKAAIKNGLIATGLFSAASIGYFLLEFQRYRNSLNRDIKAEYRKFLIKYKYSDKTPQDKNNLVQELTNRLNSLLSRCDGLDSYIPASFPKETFRDMILKLFKKEIGFGKTNPSKTSPVSRSNAGPSQNPTTPAKSRPRPQARPTKPSGGSSQGGTIKEEGV